MRHSWLEQQPERSSESYETLILRSDNIRVAYIFINQDRSLKCLLVDRHNTHSWHTNDHCGFEKCLAITFAKYLF